MLLNCCFLLSKKSACFVGIEWLLCCLCLTIQRISLADGSWPIIWLHFHGLKEVSIRRIESLQSVRVIIRLILLNENRKLDTLALDNQHPV